MPGEGETLVTVTRSGVNFADTHVTRDDYLAKQELPVIPGGEIAGRTPDGDRVAAMLMNGGYAEKVAVPDAALVPVPDEVDDDQAAALLLQGITAYSLLRFSAKCRRASRSSSHAAAGGTGTPRRPARQAPRRRPRHRPRLQRGEARARPRARAPTPRSTPAAEDLGERILEANEGEQVDVVLEMAGGQAFEDCLRVLAPFGRIVTFGIASREENSVKTGHLMRNSRAVIGFWLVHLFRRPELLREAVAEVLGAAATGDLRAVIGEVAPLSEARRVHEDLRPAHNGKILFDPTR